LADAFEKVARSDAFWDSLSSPALEVALLGMVQAEREIPIDDDYLDDITTAFGKVVDAKSPYTSGHSARVAQYTDRLVSFVTKP
jgi:HD-GYP domain-containing protein (c-di-GMP phosphodiesterase class II)